MSRSLESDSFTSKPKRQRVLTDRQLDRRSQKTTQIDEIDDINMVSLGLEEKETILPPIPQNFRYGDHTADIILHGYGKTPMEAIEATTYGMISYMFDHPDRIGINEYLTHDIVVYGKDIPDLIFKFLTEILVSSINYYDDLSEDLQIKICKKIQFDEKKLKNNSKNSISQLTFNKYPGMIPRIIKVHNLTEVDPQKSTSTISSTTLAPTTTTSTIDDVTTTTPTLQNTNLNAPNNPNKVFKLEATVQGDFVDIVQLGQGTEVKAITNELTLLEVLATNDLGEPITVEEVKDLGGKYHLQVLVDI
jgi:SHS2 domain-containing protein